MAELIMEYIWGTGPIPCDHMIIGEAPGAMEEEQGKPFVGPSGILLNEALLAGGKARDEVYVTNAYKLRPPNNRDPKLQELEEHWPMLRRELQEVDPKHILLLGRVARQFLANNPPPRGEWWVGDEGVNWMHTWHPAGTFYGKGRKEEFFEHVSKFLAR